MNVFIVYAVIMALAYPWFLRDLPATVGRARARGGLRLLMKLVLAIAVAGFVIPLIVLVSGVQNGDTFRIWTGAALALLNGVLGALAWGKYNDLASSP